MSPACTVVCIPLALVPTTAGTGSETTGIAVFDHKQLKTKIGMYICMYVLLSGITAGSPMVGTPIILV